MHSVSIMNYLRAENIAKYYGERKLFENLTLSIEKADRIALVAKNGSGKTSLLNILTGNDLPDGGSVITDKHIQVAYLPQEPFFQKGQNVWEAVFASENKAVQAVAAYEHILAMLELNHNDTMLQHKLADASLVLDQLNAWDFEARVKTILSQLNLGRLLESKIDDLSGGQLKRLALARVLMQQPDLLFMDEPTNHLDIQMIEWLEQYFATQPITLLMVTHDRYFLDKVCNKIIELDQGNLYTYKGNYAYYVEKKAQRQEYQQKEADAARKLMNKELEWMRRQPKARTTKAKSRIDDFYETKVKAAFRADTRQVEIELKHQRLGGKILEVQQLCKHFGGQAICDNFTYLFKPGERIGVVGKNGVGKTTFLNMLLGLEKPDSGKISTGDTVKFGYYSQAGMNLKENKRVIEVVTDIAEYMELSKGETLSAHTLLRRFLFDSNKQHNFVHTLSGGEKRRLFLLTIIMQKPNFLILDEPTNDLDIETLNVLEDFLAGYQGCLLIVTHDRYFMDNLTDSLFIFEGEGYIRHFNGNYQDYLNEQELKKNTQAIEEKENKTLIAKPSKEGIKKKLSYNEQRELERLNTELEQLNTRKKELENRLSEAKGSSQELGNWGNELNTIEKSIDEKEMRWLELSEFQ